MAEPKQGYARGYPNPPDPVNPDPQTLREQWRYAIRMFSKYYGQAWGSAICAGVFFFGVGWYIKGGNPLEGSPKKEERRRT